MNENKEAIMIKFVKHFKESQVADKKTTKKRNEGLEKLSCNNVEHMLEMSAHYTRGKLINDVLIDAVKLSVANINFNCPKVQIEEIDSMCKRKKEKECLSLLVDNTLDSLENINSKAILTANELAEFMKSFSLLKKDVERNKTNSDNALKKLVKKVKGAMDES